MFNKPNDESQALDKEITNVLDGLNGYTADQDEYAKMTKQLEKLYKLKRLNSKERVSNDTLALIAANLVGIVVILGYEQKNVVTSKALSFIMKLR